MVVAVVLVLLIVGSLTFHYLSPWYFLPIASNWGAIDQTVTITFWVTGIVFVLVNLFMAYCVWRYRHRKGTVAHYEPENKTLETTLVVATALGVAAMLAPGLFAWAKFIETPKDAAVLEVVARQWNFNYRFPGKDGVLGTVDAKYVSDENPFGMNPDDPHGQDDILISSPELHLPVGRPLKIELRAIDVLHDFTVPQFRAKMNMVPGLVTSVWLTPTRTGNFDAFCEQLCGIGHFAMRGKVIVEDERSFQAWLSSFPTYAQTRARGTGDAAAGKALYTVCSACHGPQGEGNPDLHAPKLSGQASWYLKRQLENFKSGARGADARDLFGKTMAPMVATLADEAAVDNVLAYITTLPDTPAPTTLQSNGPRGRNLYVTCAACHGANGEGARATNAPRLKGMSDWYIVTQLKDFKLGIRGAHPHDLYGRQMASMAATLTDDAATGDLVAYIDTFR